MKKDLPSYHLKMRPCEVRRRIITRLASLGPVFIYHIVTTNALDEIVLKCMETKGRVQDLLLEALKDGKKTDNPD